MLEPTDDNRTYEAFLVQVPRAATAELAIPESRTGKSVIALPAPIRSLLAGFASS